MSSKLFRTPLPYIALVIANIIWGLNFVVAKVTLTEFPLMSLAFLRFAFAGLLLAPFLFVEQSNAKTPAQKKQFMIELKDFPKMILVGLLMISFHISLFYMGLERTTAINASVLSLLVPILSMFAGWIILRERVYWINVAGIVCGFIGAIIILGLPLIFVGSIKGDTLAGNTLMILASISFVAGALLARQMLKKYATITVTSFLFLVAVVSFFIPALRDYFQNPYWVMQVSVLGLLGFVFIVLLSSVCAFFMYNYGIKKLGIIQADLVQYIQPAAAASLAVPLLNERVSFSFIVGTVLIVLGVYWGTLGKNDHQHHSLKHHRN